jgi:hypothetical protein
MGRKSLNRMNSSTYEYEPVSGTPDRAGPTVTATENGLGCLAQWPDSPVVTYSSLDAMVANPASATRDAMAADSDDAALAAIPISEHARRLLRAILIEVEWLPAFGCDLPNGRTLELKGIRDKGIPYAPSKWDDVPLSDAQRQAYSRAAIQLQQYGLLERITESRRDRVTHVRLTPNGLRLALQLAGPDADRSAVAEGLRRTNWGRELAAGVPIEPCRENTAPQDEQPSQQGDRTCPPPQ